MEVEREKIKIHSSVLAQESELLDNIFRMYIEDINPFVVRFEVSSGNFLRKYRMKYVQYMVI